ncbi:OmpA family protein [Sulfitobacter sediminilitoris]|uniref:OmpA family protein n=1 Tax=Sulfitobacter sediminilitoris TaxID=2698830 RepID=UPI003623CE30
MNVFQKGNTLVIRIAGSNMFGSGSDQLTDDFIEPIARVANALNEEPGPVIITGHSDNVPIKSSRFPSNMHLSLARAKSVMASMAKTIQDPNRLTAEGRAEKEPIADNSTREGRARIAASKYCWCRRPRNVRTSYPLFLLQVDLFHSAPGRDHPVRCRLVPGPFHRQ